MNFELFVSLRYLRAKRKQTFISVISFISTAGVVLGVAALILVLAIMTGFHDGVRSQILGSVPHVMVQKYGGTITDYQEVVERIKAYPQVKHATPFASKEAMILAGEDVSGVNVKGIPRGNKVFSQKITTIDGSPVEELLFDQEGTPGLLITVDTATNLGVSLGERVNVIPPLFTITPFGMIPKMKPFRVIGIINERSGVMDTYVAYIDLAIAQTFFDMKGAATGIEVEGESFDQSIELSASLGEEFGFPYVVRSWEDMFGSYLSALKLEKLGLFIVLGIIVLVAAFNIATTLIMVVMEKHRDIAILRSLGANASSIMRIFILEGTIIGVIGTAMGTLLGLFLATNADAMIKWFEMSTGMKIFDKAVYGLDHFPSVVESGDVLFVVVISLAICLLATIYPSWSASRMDPAEALRYE